MTRLAYLSPGSCRDWQVADFNGDRCYGSCQKM